MYDEDKIQITNGEKMMENLLKYSSPAKVCEESLPLGNGQLGAMVYGRTDVERISLNHDTLWSGKPGQQMVDGAYESNEKAKKLVLDGKNKLAQWELEKGFSGTWLNSYLFLGTLYITRVGSSASPTNYLRTLDLENSLVNVKYIEDGIDFEREYFVSFPDNCMMVKLRSSKPELMSLQVTVSVRALLHLHLTSFILLVNVLLRSHLNMQVMKSLSFMTGMELRLPVLPRSYATVRVNISGKRLL
jgi:alpha-L-fucosidase 2